MNDLKSSSNAESPLRATALRVLRWTVGILGVGILTRLLAPSVPDSGQPGLAPRVIQAAVQKAKQDSAGLTAIVRPSATGLSISNRDTFEWKNCRLAINPGVLSGGYEVTRALVLPRATISIPERDFAKGTGERFNSLTLKLNSFSIACDTPAGRAYHFAEPRE